MLLRWSCCSQWSPRNTENQQNSKTLNHHNDESWTSTLDWIDQCYVLISLNSKYLYCSCFTVAGYFLMSFPFMVVILVCFPSRTNFPLKKIIIIIFIEETFSEKIWFSTRTSKLDIYLKTKKSYKIAKGLKRYKKCIKN